MISLVSKYLSTREKSLRLPTRLPKIFLSYSGAAWGYSRALGFYGLKQVDIVHPETNLSEIIPHRHVGPRSAKEPGRVPDGMIPGGTCLVECGLENVPNGTSPVACAWWRMFDECARWNVPGEVCPVECARGSVPGGVCPGECARGSVPGVCARGSVPRGVCPGECARGNVPGVSARGRCPG